MRIIKHGDPEIIKNYAVPYTCTRCGCECEAVAGDITISSAESDSLKRIEYMLTHEGTEPDEIFVINCPDCGMKLSKTTAEVDAIEESRKEL